MWARRETDEFLERCGWWRVTFPASPTNAPLHKHLHICAICVCRYCGGKAGGFLCFLLMFPANDDLLWFGAGGWEGDVRCLSRSALIPLPPLSTVSFRWGGREETLHQQSSLSPNSILLAPVTPALRWWRWWWWQRRKQDNGNTGGGTTPPSPAKRGQHNEIHCLPLGCREEGIPQVPLSHPFPTPKQIPTTYLFLWMHTLSSRSGLSGGLDFLPVPRWHCVGLRERESCWSWWIGTLASSYLTMTWWDHTHSCSYYMSILGLVIWWRWICAGERVRIYSRPWADRAWKWRKFEGGKEFWCPFDSPLFDMAPITSCKKKTHPPPNDVDDVARPQPHHGN